jgi:predicted methyltransferase
MHRFGKGVDPGVDTARKLAALAPLRAGSRVLDVCTGLGYTACAAAQRGAEVTTVELDDAMQAMCAANPWSRIAAPVVPLPAGRGSAAMQAAMAPGSVTQLRGDAAVLLAALAEEIAAGTRPRFDRILTDPPSFALAGMLYSTAFYADLRACLSPKGKLYHYVGDPASAHGARVARGVVKRLRDVGFEGVAIDDYAHGVVAANEFVRPTRPRAEAPGRRAPAGAAADRRGYGMKGRTEASAGRAGQRVRGANAARLMRSLDDDYEDEE